MATPTPPFNAMELSAEPTTLQLAQTITRLYATESQPEREALMNYFQQLGRCLAISGNTLISVESTLKIC